jgi:hypothetical protein
LTFIAWLLAVLTPIAADAQMPPLPDANNLYSETTAGKLSPSVAGHLARVDVPNRRSNDVTVID